MTPQSHRSDPWVLRGRTLERDHRWLQEVLQPGMRVMDVGCGVGAITAGIARAVGPSGTVLGVDRDDSLLAIARRDHDGIANLSFELRDALAIDAVGAFDVVTAARTLQWIVDVAGALDRMQRATAPEGWLVVLDYVHEENSWDPSPPPEFHQFYRAFLDWRTAHTWDNRLGARLPALFEAAGLRNIDVRAADEVAERGTPGFDAAARIWSSVIESVGGGLVEEGYIDAPTLGAAERTYDAFVRDVLRRQTLSLRCVIARVPSPGTGSGPSVRPLRSA